MRPAQHPRRRSPGGAFLLDALPASCVVRLGRTDGFTRRGFGHETRRGLFRVGDATRVIDHKRIGHGARCSLKSVGLRARRDNAGERRAAHLHLELGLIVKQTARDADLVLVRHEEQSSAVVELDEREGADE